MVDKISIRNLIKPNNGPIKVIIKLFKIEISEHFSHISSIVLPLKSVRTNSKVISIYEILKYSKYGPISPLSNVDNVLEK